MAVQNNSGTVRKGCVTINFAVGLCDKSVDTLGFVDELLMHYALRMMALLTAHIQYTRKYANNFWTVVFFESV